MTKPRYVELQVTSHFSFLRGASSCEELFAQAALAGIEALAVVDRNSLAGIVRAHEAAIPYKVNEKDKPGFFAKALYCERARIEQAVGKLKRFKRVALRCEKTKRNFTALVAIAAAFVLVKSVHTA